MTCGHEGITEKVQQVNCHSPYCQLSSMHRHQSACNCPNTLGKFKEYRRFIGKCDDCIEAELNPPPPPPPVVTATQRAVRQGYNPIYFKGSPQRRR
ncbi:hypothetical protein JAAARDRAFT_210571 [Jaapia argillacea MUCL 33604]|uniref:Uncharacterized protein n=1 Tax=Jaapia argillacea MUCL 33604 TaxID=933084 RepID=A0A067PC74_9AGAM|nr:hypothetical protein JAAARDRAFT_210571 [Jaapia argillacea MUCL 33604]